MRLPEVIPKLHRDFPVAHLSLHATDLLGRTPDNTIVEKRMVESRFILKPSPSSRVVRPNIQKPNQKCNRRPECMNKELLTKLKHKKEAYKQRQINQEAYTDAAQTHR